MILSLDIGTSKLCALVWDETRANVVAVRSAPNAATVAGLPSGHHEQDPAKVVVAIHELIGEVLTDPAVKRAAVTDIAITGQAHGAMLIGRDGMPLTNFVTWRDQRTAGMVHDANLADSDGWSRCGGPLCAGYGGLLLSTWTRERRITGGALAVSLLDYVAFSLCGVLATERTHAASWGLLGLWHGDWDAERIGLLGIPWELLPELKPSCAPLAKLLSNVSAKFSLPNSVMVHAPVGDNQASVAGVGGFAPGACVLNLGTGGQISFVRSDFAVDPSLETRPMPGGGFLQVGASLCGGESYALLERFYRDVVREVGGIELSQQEVYERMNESAARADVDAGGIVADTRFAGTRGDANLRGQFGGLGTSNLTAGNLARAVVNGMVRELAEMVRRPGSPPVTKLFATGNGVRRNPLVLETISREFCAQCSLSLYTEEAAIGAAICAEASRDWK